MLIWEAMVMMKKVYPYYEISLSYLYFSGNDDVALTPKKPKKRAALTSKPKCEFLF